MRWLVIVAVMGCAACAASGPRPDGQGGDGAAMPRVLLGPRGAAKAAQSQRDPRSVPYLLEVDGLGLFRDERVEAHQRLAAWAATRGLKVVDPLRAEALLARTREGKHPDSGERCGVPQADWRARARWAEALGAQGLLRATVGCDPKEHKCTLRVSATDSLGMDGALLLDEVARWPLNRPWPEALTAGLQALALPNDEGGAGGLGLLGGLMGRVVTARPEELTVSFWPARATDFMDEQSVKDAITLKGGLAPLRTCLAPDTRAAELLVALDGAGHVTRCESREADDAASLCACAVLLKSASTTLPVLKGGRGVIDVRFSAADVVTPSAGRAFASANPNLDEIADGDNVFFQPRVSDPSIEAWQPPVDSALSRCFATSPIGAARDVLATVTFDDKGKATDVVLKPSKRTTLSAAERACVKKAMLTSEAPCPAQGGATAQAMVHIAVDKLGAPLASPF